MASTHEIIVAKLVRAPSGLSTTLYDRGDITPRFLIATVNDTTWTMVGSDLRGTKLEAEKAFWQQIMLHH